MTKRDRQAVDYASEAYSVESHSVTVAEVLKVLDDMGNAYERMCLGVSPTGNYSFACSAALACVTMRAAVALIRQTPAWIHVSERLPEAGQECLVYSENTDDDFGRFAARFTGEHWVTNGGSSWNVKLLPYWMPLPEPPEAA